MYFSQENRLTWLNTKFQKREGKLWTNTYANNTKTQIDYVFINKKWNNRALNCEAYSSFKSVSSDHRIVTAKIRLSLRRDTSRAITTVHYDWVPLHNKDIWDKSAFILRNKFDALQEKTETHNLESHGRYYQLEKKRSDLKTASKCHRNNPNNTNDLKLKKAQNELVNIYLKEQTEYIKNQIGKIRDPVKDRQCRIT